MFFDDLLLYVVPAHVAAVFPKVEARGKAVLGILCSLI
jgi:hypothetical protein